MDCLCGRDDMVCYWFMMVGGMEDEDVLWFVVTKEEDNEAPNAGRGGWPRGMRSRARQGPAYSHLVERGVEVSI